jgi:glycosyltransferase involved in cell wall biosynthesis
MSKVVLLGSAHPLRGGLATYNERLAREFQNNGDEVIIYTFSLQYPGFLFPGKTQHSPSPKPDDLDIRVKVNSINPLNWWKVGKELRKLKPDLLIIKYWLPFMGPCFGTIARQVKKNGHTKVISILDNIIPHEKRPGDKAFTKYFVKPVDAFVAQSQSVLEDTRQFDTQKPRAFQPHPLFDNFGERTSREEAVQKLGLDPQYRYMLFFGFIRDYKGLDILLKALADKNIRELPVKLIVAGEYYANQEKYESMIREYGVGDQLVLRNEFIPDEEVAHYFNAADVIVQPYKNATQSGVTQIGFHFNKPMIVTNVGGLPEIIPDGKVGYVVEPNEVDLSKAIQRFFKEDKYEKFSANAAEEKKKYGWDRMVKKIYELVEEVG